MSKQTIGPTLPPGWASSKTEAEASDDEDSHVYGPTLPPVAQNQSNDEKESSERVIGPTLPSSLRDLNRSETKARERYSVSDVIRPSISSANDSEDDSSGEEVIGPLPESHHSYDKINEKFADCSQHLSKKDTKSDRLEREEWMTVVPERLAPKLPTKSVKHFSQRPVKSNRKEKDFKRDDKRDQELTELMDSFNKNQKRDVSLLDIHSDKSNKKKKSEQKVEERVPFDPEKDLSVRRMNSRQTQSVLNKAKTFNDRFSLGVNKFL